MYPCIIGPDKTITLVVGNKEHTVAPASHQYEEILWCIENEMWDPIPELLAARELQEEAVPSSNIWRRSQAIKALQDLVEPSDYSPEELVEELKRYEGMTNRELAETLDLAGYFDCDTGPPIVADDPQTVVETDFGIRETIERSEAIEILEESMKETKAFIEALQGVGADINVSFDLSGLSNDELKTALEGIGVSVKQVID
jgi:hypothetical protein